MGTDFSYQSGGFDKGMNIIVLEYAIDDRGYAMLEMLRSMGESHVWLARAVWTNRLLVMLPMYDAQGGPRSMDKIRAIVEAAEKAIEAATKAPIG